MSLRTPVIAGNWKMNTDVESGVALAQDILELCDGVSGVDKIVCPPFVVVPPVVDVLAGSSIQVGVQNANAHSNGAFSGEISTSMLAKLVSHVIVGHSERRTFFGETSADVAEKAVAVADAGLNPILCIGEGLEVRKQGREESFVAAQLKSSLNGYTKWDSLIVAYEPIWAIGTGEPASSQHAQEIIKSCRRVVRQLAFSAADSIRFLYGGSVNSGNIVELIAQPDIDGALAGGASLKADEFTKLIAATGSA